MGDLSQAKLSFWNDARTVVSKSRMDCLFEMMIDFHFEMTIDCLFEIKMTFFSRELIIILK